MHGILADRPLFHQLLVLLGLCLMGALLFTSLGMGLSGLLYPMSPDELLQGLSMPQNSIQRQSFKLVQGFNTLGLFLVPALVGARLFAHQPEKFLGLSHFPTPVWLVLFLLALLSYGMSGLSDALYRAVEQIPWPGAFAEWQDELQEKQRQMNAIYENLLQMLTPWQFLEMLIVMALLPAVAEEALFRGVLQPLLQRRLSVHGAVWITAGVFGLLHGQFYAFASITVLGAVMGYLRAWSGSLWVPTVLHFINNASIVILSYGFGYQYSQGLEPGQSGGSLSEYILLSAILALCMLLLRNIFRKANK